MSDTTIAQARQRLGLSLRSAAFKLAMTPERLQLLEAGMIAPNLATARHLAATLGGSPEDYADAPLQPLPESPRGRR